MAIWWAKMSRTVLTSNIVLYCTTSGSSGGTGASSNPFRQPQQVIELLASDYDLGKGCSVDIICAAGDYSAILHKFQIPGLGGPSQCVISSTEAARIITTDNTAVSLLGPGAMLCIKGMRIEVSGHGDCIKADFGAWVQADGITIGNGADHFHATHGGMIEAFNYTVDGDAEKSHWNAAFGGHMKIRTSVTVSTTIDVGEAWATAAQGGLLEVTACTFTGSSLVTGTKYKSIANGVVESGGGTMPGTVVGWTYDGGIYR